MALPEREDEGLRWSVDDMLMVDMGKGAVGIRGVWLRLIDLTTISLIYRHLMVRGNKLK